MTARREAIIRAKQLPLYGRISSYLADRAIISRLVAGRWLDVLSGYDATLLVEQRQIRKITERHALDHRLNPNLPALGIQIRECYIETELPFDDNAFDNITLVNGLEHLWHPQEILNDCHRVLSPGGVLQVTVPTWLGKPILEFLAFKLKHEQAFIEMNDHKMYYDERTLWPMLVRAGFEPQRIIVRSIKLGFSLHAIAAKGSRCDAP